MIPLTIYQTWHTKKLPAEMRESVNQIKKASPEFTYMLFDDADCRDFIEEYFPSNVLDAYDKLIPGAYKADLWRYCVLYVAGGIYIDIKYRPVPTFKMIQLTRSEHFVNDLQDAYVKVDGVYNGVMACKPQNNAMLKCINEIVHNATVSYYGRSPLEPTGPILLRKHSAHTDMQLKLNTREQLQIVFNNHIILYSYLNYRKDQRMFEIYPHYSRLWLAKSIYRRNTKVDGKKSEMIKGDVPQIESNVDVPQIESNVDVPEIESNVDVTEIDSTDTNDEYEHITFTQYGCNNHVTDIVDEPKSVAEPVSEYVAEYVAEPVSEPVAEPVSEHVAEPVSEPVAEPEPIAVSVTTHKPVVKPVVKQVDHKTVYNPKLEKKIPLVVYRPSLNNIIFNSP